MSKENQILIELLEGVKYWSDLKDKLERFNTSQSEKSVKKTQAGKIFEIFAKYYLQTDPKKTELYKNVWLYDEVSSDVREELRLPSIDHGIDLLLQDTDNNFHAVQCKFKNDETKSLSWSGDKIANVFALGTNCHKIIVFTNASDTTSVAKAFEQKFEQIAFDELNSIETDIFSNILELARGNQPKELKKHTPKEHQKEAIEKVVLHFKNNDRGQLILPCGAGKTVTALWIKENLKPKTTLVLVPSLALLKQIKNDWARHKNSFYNYLCVCSEKDIDKDSNKEDNVILHTYEIGGPVTTDAENVKSFLLREGEKVVFSTYQSLEVIVNAVKKIQDFYFDFVICDEAHRTAGGKDKNTFTLVHYDVNLPSRKRLYMTATPKIVSKKLKRKLGEDYELFCDMSNPKIYGDEAYHMTFGDAISRKILVDYKIIGIGVSDLQVKKYIDERKYLGNYTAEELANNYALELVMNNYGAFHSISFHWKVEFAQAFAIRHKGLFPEVFSKSVNGNQTTTHRAKTLQEFKDSPKGLVSNARCLTEGVDVPSIDLIYFCDPKTSVIDIVQASGRALRIDPSGVKKEGYIVVPIFHYENQDVETEIKKKPIFEHLIQVIRSLCDHDERLRAEINEIAFKKGARSNSRIRIDFPDSKIEKIIKLEGIEEKVRDVLFDEIIEKTSSNWELRFLEIKDYIEKNGHSTISKKNTDYSELYHWVGNQRRYYYEGRLESSKIKRLNEIGFDWKGENRREITDLDEIWRQGYLKLQEYFKSNGHSNVPARFEENKSLGTWVVTQRVKYDDGKLVDWQIELLERISFDWDPKNKFEDFFQELVKFKEENGHLKVPTIGNERYKSLGRWVNKMRTIYNAGTINDDGDIVVPLKGRIKANQLERLNQLGFLWYAGKTDWNIRFSELQEYFKVNGHSNVSQAENMTLYYWCYRNKKNRESLSPEQLEKLKTVDFSYDIGLRSDDNESDFIDRVIELQQFQEETGGFIFYKDFEEYNSLKIWLANIRKKYREGNLEQEKIDFLKSIGFNEDDYSPVDKKWNDRFKELKEYYASNKNYQIPNLQEYRNLRLWLKYQIKAFSEGKLEEEKIELLKSIEFNFSSENLKLQKKSSGPRIEVWINRINELKDFYKKNNSWHIPSTDKENRSLLLWLRRIKQEKEKGILAPEREADLISIGFDFNLKERIINHESFKKRSENIWKSRIDELRNYYNLNKTFFISTNDKEHNSLLQWLIGVRKKYKNSELESEKIDELKLIGLDLSKKFSAKVKKDIIDPRWFSMFNDFKNHFYKNKTFSIDASNPSNSKLVNWIRTQRVQFNSGKLIKEKLSLLEGIGYSFTEVQEKGSRKNISKIGFESKWNENFEALKTYYELHNSFLISQNNEENKKLRAWLQTQRAQYRNGNMPKNRYDKLIAIGYDFNLNFTGKTTRRERKVVRQNNKEDSWDKKYLQLLSFKMRYGHCNVTRKESFSLSQWLNQQRSDKRNSQLTSEQIQKLDFLGVEWLSNNSTNINDIWEQRFDEYKSIIEHSGRHSVSKNENSVIANWIVQQRVKWKKGKLTETQINTLNSINFEWEPEHRGGGFPDDEQWFLKFQELESYKQKFGHCNVSQIDKVYKKLGRWLNDQRVSYSRGKLLEHRQSLLVELGVIWNIKEHEWNSKLQMLSDYYTEHGHFNVKQSEKDFPSLYDWIFRIKKKGTSSERKERLRKIGFDTTEIETNESN